MQSILYHNSSGAQAFTGSLKKKEVHRAITLHPVKSPPHMYRLHNYMRVGVLEYNNDHNRATIITRKNCITYPVTVKRHMANKLREKAARFTLPGSHFS
jgi:hypothetical protein